MGASTSSVVDRSPELMADESTKPIPNSVDDGLSLTKQPERQPVDWPAPPRVLQTNEIIPNVPSFPWSFPPQPMPTTSNHTACCKQVHQDLEILMASIKKKTSYVTGQFVVLFDKLREIRATLTDVVSAVERNATTANSSPSHSHLSLSTAEDPANDSPPPLRLPLCTAEAYEDFVRRLSTQAGFADELVKRLSLVTGRNEKEYIRNLLSSLLAPPLCLNFCWAGSARKRSFVGCPLSTILYDIIRRNPTFNKCEVEIVRMTAIGWFHGSVDRYGGRTKRRASARKFPSGSINASAYPRPSSSEDIL
nr:unnamed protein product [Spirometra erinaceieuropaei]